MAFGEELAGRVRKLLTREKGLTERKMFGGLAFLLNGNMCCGVHGGELIVRLDPTRTDNALVEPHTRVFDLSGRPMKGWILVELAGLADEPALAKWLHVALRSRKWLAPAPDRVHDIAMQLDPESCVSRRS